MGSGHVMSLQTRFGDFNHFQAASGLPVLAADPALGNTHAIRWMMRRFSFVSSEIQHEKSPCQLK